MAQAPMLTHDSQYYQIINESLLANGYTSMSEFFEEEYKDYFQGAEWTELLNVGAPNMSGQFTQVIGGKKVPILATMTSDDGDAPLLGTRGMKVQTLEMFRTKLAYSYNEKSVEEAAHLLANGARVFNYGGVFDNFVLDNAILIGSINVARSYAAFQLESTGKLTTTAANAAGGMVNVNIDYRVPAANRVNAGFNSTVKAAWSDPTADPLKDIVDLFKLSKLSRDRAVIRMAESTWVQILEHPSTKTRLAMWKSAYLIPAANIDSFIVLEDELLAYMTRGLRLPNVEVVSYIAASQAVDPNSQEIVYDDLQAFEDNTVLIRPSGKIGFLDWKPVTDMFATSANPMFYAENRMTSIQQLTYTAEKAAKIVAEACGAPNPYDVTSFYYLTTNVAAV